MQDTHTPSIVFEPRAEPRSASTPAPISQVRASGLSTAFFGAYTWLLCTVLPALVSHANLGVWILSTLSLVILGLASTRLTNRSASLRQIALLVAFPIANLMALASYRPWSISMTAMAVLAQVIFFIACASEAQSEPLDVLVTPEPQSRGAKEATRRERWRTTLIAVFTLGFVWMTFAVAYEFDERPGSLANAQIFAAIIGTTALATILGRRLRRTKRHIIVPRARVLAVSAAVTVLATTALLLVKVGRL